MGESGTSLGPSTFSLTAKVNEAGIQAPDTRHQTPDTRHQTLDTARDRKEIAALCSTQLAKHLTQLDQQAGTFIMFHVVTALLVPRECQTEFTCC
jgi:hypothetical protein